MATPSVIPCARNDQESDIDAIKTTMIK